MINCCVLTVCICKYIHHIYLVHYYVYKSPPLVPVLSTIRELNCENFILIQVLLNKLTFKLKVWIFVLCGSKLLLINIISLKHKCFRNKILHSWWFAAFRYSVHETCYPNITIQEVLIKIPWPHTPHLSGYLLPAHCLHLTFMWQGKQFPLYVVQLVPQVINFTGTL